MSDSESAVESRWKELTKLLPEDVVQTWWKTTQEKYGQPLRKYHNMAHLHRLYNLVDNYKSQISNPDALYYALLFQHLEYDPQSTGNEEANIQLFKEFAEATKRLKDLPLFTDVVELLGLTSTHITEEHKSKDSYGKDDKHFFLDLEMSYLGVSPTEYSIYTKQIREEYNFLSDKSYNTLRSKILKSFLQIPNIFATKEFRDAYEKQARNNIEEEISDLAS